jgi:hypothetical protein
VSGPSLERSQGRTAQVIIPEAAVSSMAVPIGAIPMTDGGWALVQRLGRDDLAGLALALPALWLLLSAADWRAVFSL